MEVGNRSPCRSSKQAEILPAEFKCTVVLHQSVAIRWEHSKQESSLGGSIACERYALESRLLKLLPPVVELHLTAP